MQRMDFLQADNEMKTFAKETGGQAFFPRFQGEYGSIFGEIHQALRNQYVITYAPSNKAHDGTFRKIKIELVNPATNEPLPVKDEKGKPSSTRLSPRLATKRLAKWNSPWFLRSGVSKLGVIVVCATIACLRTGLRPGQTLPPAR